MDEPRPVLNYTFTSLDYETDIIMDLNSNIMKNRLKRQQFDGKSIEIKKSWKNVRPTGLEIAIQFGCQNILV